MSNITGNLSSIRITERLALRKSMIHRINPIVKLLTTIVFLIVVISFGKNEVSGLMPLFIYPILIMSLADIPLMPIVKRLFTALPFVFFIAVFSLFTENGVIAFSSIMLKFILTVTAALILVSTTPMPELCKGLKNLKTPDILILQFTMMYRYIQLLAEEVQAISMSYLLRAQTDRIRIADYIHIVGRMLMRSFEKAQNIYHSMVLKGFEGQFTAQKSKLNFGDILYLIVVCSVIIIMRFINIAEMVGGLF